MDKEFTRREIIGAGLGVAAVALAGAAISTTAAAQEAPASKAGANTAAGLSEFNKYGEELENGLLLRTSPIAVKMIEKEEDIPKGAFRPKRDGGIHIAQCQAFGMSRRQGKTVAMLKEDHWCPTALMAYGMVPKQSGGFFGEAYMTFDTGKYIGIVTAPLKSATFMPDVVMIYMNPAQLRGALLPMNFSGADQVKTELFLPSCGHAVVDPMKTGKYVVVLPDPGEYQRGLATEDEMILSVPQAKMQPFMASLKQRGKMYSHRDQYMDMKPDFEQPQFYKDMFKQWGLGQE
ncbi:MAG: DUF169 domain-containing protein [Deltaproteobacteria bacterium]|nr:DUF169 domain-containing protein [Deltaproteobacteria bacterium]